MPLKLHITIDDNILLVDGDFDFPDVQPTLLQFMNAILQSPSDVTQLRRDVRALQAQGAHMALTQQQFDERMTQMDEATTEIAKDLQELRDQLASQGISDASLAILDAKIARLQTLGQEPAPPTTPTPGGPAPEADARATSKGKLR